MLTSCHSRCSSSPMELWTNKVFCYFQIFLFWCRMKQHYGSFLREKENTWRKACAVRFPHSASLLNKWSLGQCEHMDCFGGEDKCAFRQSWPETDWCHCKLFLIQMKFLCGESRSICCVTQGKKVQEKVMSSKQGIKADGHLTYMNEREREAAQGRDWGPHSWRYSKEHRTPTLEGLEEAFW